jgi:Ca2+-transporting ATPase
MKECTSSDIMQQAVGLNTTGTIYKLNSSTFVEIFGSPMYTENAILSWATFYLGMNIDEIKQTCEIIHLEAFNSEKKRSEVLVKRKSEKAMCTHWKGVTEIILPMCSNYYDKTRMLKAMDEEERVQLRTIIKNMIEKKA